VLAAHLYHLGQRRGKLVESATTCTLHDLARLNRGPLGRGSGSEKAPGVEPSSSTKGFNRLGTFDFDALTRSQVVVVTPCFPEESKISHVRYFAPSPPQRQNQPDGSRSTRCVEDVTGGHSEAVIKRTYGRGAAKEVMRGVLNRSAADASGQSGGGNGVGGPDQDVPETEGGQQGLASAGEAYQDQGRYTSLVVTTPPYDLQGEREGEARGEIGLEALVETGVEWSGIQESADDHPKP